MKKILLQFLALSLFPSFASAYYEMLPSIIAPEAFKNARAILTRVADGNWDVIVGEQPEKVRLVVVRNPPQEQDEPLSTEPTSDNLLQLLKHFPKMEACDIREFLFRDMTPFFEALASYENLETLRIAKQNLDRSEMETLFKLPLKSLEFSNSTLNAENAAPLPKTLEVFSYQVMPCLRTQTPYNLMDATFFKQANNLRKVEFNYPDAWKKFWEKPANLKNSSIKEIYLSQPSVWEQRIPSGILENTSSLASFPTSLKPNIFCENSQTLFNYCTLYSENFKHLKTFSFHEYGSVSLKGLSYTKDKNQWSFFGWPDLPENASDSDKSTCLKQWESQLEEIQKSFPGSQFHFSNMGPSIMAKFQEMQQQDAWKSKISFSNESSDEADETYTDSENSSEEI